MRGRSPPRAFPSGGRCPQRGRMRGTVLIMQAVRFPRAAEGGGPYRWGHLMPRRAAARTAPTQAKDRFQLTCRGGACPSRSVFRRRGGPVCPPGCTGPQSSGHTHRCAPTGISAIPRKNRGGQRLPQGRPVSAPYASPSTIGAGALTRPPFLWGRLPAGAPRPSHKKPPPRRCGTGVF